MTFETAVDWWIWLLLFALTGWVIFLDFRSRPTKLRAFRVLAILLVSLSLIGLYLKPSLKTQFSSKKVAIVTDGATEVTLDGLRSINYELMTLDEFVLSDEVSSVVVVGNGLEEWELTQLHVPFDFLSDGIQTEGPTEAVVRQAIANSEMSIQLLFEVKTEARVILSGTGIEVVEKNVTSKNNSVLFKVTPAVSGNFLFEINGVQKQDTIFSELLPLRIAEPSQLNMLILSGSPSFEIRFLKNHLAQMGVGVAERQQISKGTFREAFTNLSRRSLAGITDNLLENFSLVILDEVAFEALSGLEKKNLKASLRSGRIGLLWLGDESQLFQLESQPRESIEIQGNSGAVNMIKSGVTAINGTRLLIQEASIGSLISYGLGIIVFPEVSDIYRLALKGEKKLYNEAWQTLLQPALGREFQNVNFELESHGFENEPFSMLLLNPEGRIEIDGLQVGVEELWFRPGYFRTKYWPQKNGWHQISNGNISESFYVFERDDWKAKKSKEARVRTHLASAFSETKSKELQEVLQPISKWFFFCGFLVGFTFIWIEQRLN